MRALDEDQRQPDTAGRRRQWNAQCLRLLQDQVPEGDAADDPAKRSVREPRGHTQHAKAALRAGGGDDDDQHDETSQSLHHDHHTPMRSRPAPPYLSPQLRRLSGRTDLPDGRDWLLLRRPAPGLRQCRGFLLRHGDVPRGAGVPDRVRGRW